MFHASSAQSSGSTSSSISRSFSSAQSMNSDSRIWPPPFLSILANSASMSSMGPTHWKMDVRRVRRFKGVIIFQSLFQLYATFSMVSFILSEVNSSLSTLWSSPVSSLTTSLSQYDTLQNSKVQYYSIHLEIFPSLVTWRGGKVNEENN